MEFRSTIDNKRIFVYKNGEKVIDFTQQNWNPDEGIIINAIRITDEFAMRPDLIAKLQYQDINMTDLVLKQNGISNPFSIDVNDILYFQEKRKIEKQFKRGDIAKRKEQVRSQYIDTSKKPKTDDTLKQFENREKVKKKEISLPPNFANFGDQEIKLRGGKVIFGEDVTANKEVCEEKPLSKSELLKRLIKNRLNKK